MYHLYIKRIKDIKGPEIGPLSSLKVSPYLRALQNQGLNTNKYSQWVIPKRTLAESYSCALPPKYLHVLQTV